MEEKIKPSIICDLAIVKVANEIFNDMYNEGVEEDVHTEGRIEEMAEIVFAVIDDLIDNTACDMEAKKMCCEILYSEASVLDIVTPQGHWQM